VHRRHYRTDVDNNGDHAVLDHLDNGTGDDDDHHHDHHEYVAEPGLHFLDS
jgi:hypothetical protein